MSAQGDGKKLPMSLSVSRLKRNTSGTAFSNDDYIKSQKEKIMERLKMFDKVYLEFGGKLVFDYHAHRVLPGYDPNVKLDLIASLIDEADLIMCISALDVERNKINSNSDLPYVDELFKNVDRLSAFGIDVTAFVVSRYDETKHRNSTALIKRLERKGFNVYTRGEIEGFPNDVEVIVSDRGFGSCDHIKTTKKLVIVTAPGPGSGKLTTCLCQLYHDRKKGVKSYYAKFETFPVWNLPLDSAINIAYEAATIDLKDKNCIDLYYKAKHGKDAVNYNRDMEAFPILRSIFEVITGENCVYDSPTDMGVNMIKAGIVDEAACIRAAKDEIIRRFFSTQALYYSGSLDQDSVDAMKALMKKANVRVEDMAVVKAAREFYDERKKLGVSSNVPLSTAALDLGDGKCVVSHSSLNFHAAAVLVIEAVKKKLGKGPNEDIIPDGTLDSLRRFRQRLMISSDVDMSVEEVVLSLVTSSNSEDFICALEESFLDKNVHFTFPPSRGDLDALRKLGACITYENYAMNGGNAKNEVSH